METRNITSFEFVYPETKYLPGMFSNIEVAKSEPTPPSIFAIQLFGIVKLYKSEQLNWQNAWWVGSDFATSILENAMADILFLGIRSNDGDVSGFHGPWVRILDSKTDKHRYN